MISIILPVHNRRETTATFLDSLLNQEYSDYRLMLVNDGCMDGTVELTRERIPARQLQVLEGGGDLWWGGALQLAWEHLRYQPTLPADVVLIINDDVTFGSEFLRAGLRLLERHPNACIQAVCRDRHTGEEDHGTRANLISLRFRAVREGETPNCLSTRGLMLRMNTFVHTRGFVPHRLPHYLSDYEFTIRLGREGLLLLTDSSFILEGDAAQSGYSVHCRRGIRQFIRDAFNNRSKRNPRHWTAFILCACPWWVVPVHLARVWARFSLGLIASALLPDSRHGSRAR